MAKSEIARFFDDRSVFVSGGTGLMGKVLVWKLLNSCPGIKAIYVLIRSKRGKSALLRYQEIIKAPVSRCATTSSFLDARVPGVFLTRLPCYDNTSRRTSRAKGDS